LSSLRDAVPHWTESPSGIVTGRFDDGIGYILFPQCRDEQASDFDEAMETLKDTKALILDVRCNQGGSDKASKQVAGWFVAWPAVYTRERTRKDGKWTGPFDWVVRPREDGRTYTKPVVVLIGPRNMSSAEAFICMMRYGSRARLIGATTRGSSGNPLPHDLGNGVTVYLPSWETQNPDGSLREGHGIAPDIRVETDPDDLKNSDPVLDAALKSLRGGDDRGKSH
jgi:carboxyl-terminal processing protease